MLIEVRTDSNVHGGEPYSEHVKGVVHAALDRFGGRISGTIIGISRIGKTRSILTRRI